MLLHCSVVIIISVATKTPSVGEDHETAERVIIIMRIRTFSTLTALS